MSRSLPSRALTITGNVALGALTFFGLRGLYVYAQGFIVSDPFAKLRQEEHSGLAPSVGVRLGDVKVNAYRNGRLITSGMADQIDVNSQDRELFTLTHIRDGLFTQDGKQYRYSANQAVWQGVGRQLTMSGMVRIRNADLDLRTDSVEFNDTLHTLNTPQPISGRFYHGTLSAVGFKMDTQTQGYTTGKVDYSGDLAMWQDKDDSDDNTPKEWHVTGDNSKSVPGKDGQPTVTYYINGIAKNDEMILKADLVADYKDTEKLIASGNVKYFSGKADISADRATVYRKEKKIVLVGHVTIYVKPKSDEKKPPVEEPLPPFKRTKPEELIVEPPPGAAGGSAVKTGSTPAGSGTSAPPLSTGSPAPQPVGSGATPAGSTSGAPGSVSPAVTPQSATPSAPTSTPAAGQTSPPHPPATPPTSKTPPASGKAPGQSKETPEQKKLDEDLRSGKTVRKYPMVIVCDEVDYWYKKGERHGHIVGSPQGKQDLPEKRWRYVWSTTADYDAEKDELTLYSGKDKRDVRMKNSKGDDLVALTMTVSTKEDADVEEYAARKPEAVFWDEPGDDDTATGDKTKKKG